MKNHSNLSDYLEWKPGGLEQYCLDHFLATNDDQSANLLCTLAFPRSSLRDLQLSPCGQWTAVVMYDNLLHDGEGPTEGAALMNALKKISNGLAYAR